VTDKLKKHKFIPCYEEECGGAVCAYGERSADCHKTKDDPIHQPGRQQEPTSKDYLQVGSSNEIGNDVPGHVWDKFRNPQNFVPAGVYIGDYNRLLAYAKQRIEELETSVEEIRLFAIHGCGTKQKDIRGRQFGKIVDIASKLLEARKG
jgi:hypothetical protein